MAMDSPACAATIATNAGQARARRSGTLSPSGNGTSPTRAIQSANAAGSLRRISSAVRPSQRPIAISRSAGIMVGVSPCREAMISAVRARALEIAREHRGEPGAGEPRGLRPALPLAVRGERHVEVADEPARLGEDHLAVAQEVDQGLTCAHADTARRDR